MLNDSIPFTALSGIFNETTERKRDYFQKGIFLVRRNYYNNLKEEIDWEINLDFEPVDQGDWETFYYVNILFYNEDKLYHYLLHEDIFEKFIHWFDVESKEDPVSKKWINYMICDKKIVNNEFNLYKKNMDYRILDEDIIEKL